ncbi:hypothetical protein [Brachyspira aalborgi]|uniref:DUF1430 domain-containing protein n=1 Tax=Brachyspira aalborgi TaxID=29522 RepID=A0ABY3K6W2_9SPIR|nr:hypothetical protein [Brachyspira aalborgi]MBS4762894.1 hypothetical protein [Brachyspira sp.]TXJ31235.1 hypothetical protein EPJ71_10925 [Brachyspira aalborgi]TXJ40621.1 hypothetical protein EPJ65_10645 [Brachyspira aalborgi]
MKDRIINNIFALSIIIIALNLINAFIFMLPYINYKSKKYAYSDFYNNFNIDFDIPSPSKNQINELRNLDFIEKVIPYYYANLTLNYGENIDSNILFFDSLEDIEYIYNDNRLINKVNKTDNFIYVDYYFIKDSKAKLNDTLKTSINGVEIKFNINGIYKENLYYNNGVEASIWKKEYLNRNIEYSGAFIKAKDINLCRNYLSKEYKPLGRLKSRDNFDTEESYNIHIKAILSGNYANEITDFNLKSESDINFIESGYISNIIRYALGIFLVFIIIILINNYFLSKNKDYFYNRLIIGEELKNIKNSYFLLLIISLIISIVSNIILIKIVVANIEYYIPLKNIFISINIIILFEIISIILSYYFNIKEINLLNDRAISERKGIEEEKKTNINETNEI